MIQRSSSVEQIDIYIYVFGLLQVCNGYVPVSFYMFFVKCRLITKIRTKKSFTFPHRLY